MIANQQQNLLLPVSSAGSLRPISSSIHLTSLLLPIHYPHRLVHFQYELRFKRVLPLHMQTLRF